MPRQPLQPQRASLEAQQMAMLPETKLSRPRLPLALVARERLLSALNAALEHRLLLLSASAGWGKTTLLSAWAGRQPHGIAWVSLDELDNDPTRFWVSVMAALRACLPTVADVALAMLHSPQPPPLSAILTSLLNDLASVATPAAPIVLILDDYQVIEDAAIHEGLTFLLEHLPEPLHLVLASRVDPDLPLARWRARGQLAEIRAADLRFTANEASRFFTLALGDVLEDDDVRLLERRTEGWVAGLQLAAIAIHQREDRSAFVQMFTGSHRYLLDYIQEEVLQSQPLPVQRFLLHTAVLRRMNAALCAALTDDPASQEMLELLERNNLFVVPLDEHRHWYRVHDLFREVLLARLHTTQPEVAPGLHQRAARWYEGQNELPEAIAHALTAADFSYAASLMERAAEGVWLNGESKLLYRWVMALPDAVVQRHARMVLTAALYLINSSASTAEAQQIQARTEAELMMARVEAALLREKHNAPDPVADKELPAREAELLRRRLSLLRGWLAGFEATAQGDVEGMQSICRQLLEDLDPEDDVIWGMIPLSETFILRFSFLREGAFLAPMLLEAKARASRAGDRFATIKVMQWLALSHLQAGHLRQAHQESLAALDLLKRSDGHAILAGYFYSVLASVAYQWNKLEESAATLRKMIQDAQAWQQVDLQVVGYMQLVEVEIASRNLVGAQEALREAEQVSQSQGLTYVSAVASVQAQVWLAQGNLTAASDWASHVVFSSDTWNPMHAAEFLMLVSVYLAQGRHTQAREALERFSVHLDRPGDLYTTTYYLALHMAALHGEGRTEQAGEVAVRLFLMTEPEGFIRLYLDIGEPMREALQGLLSTQRSQNNGQPTLPVSYILKLLAAFEHDEQEKRMALPLPAQPSGAPSVPPPDALPMPMPVPTGKQSLAEPLTQREQEVLRLLVSGASNGEIAAQLVVSLATVKKHVSNILGKLGVESRTQAVARAREYSLL